MPRKHLILTIAFVCGLILPLRLGGLVEPLVLLSITFLLLAFRRFVFTRIFISFGIAMVLSTLIIALRISQQLDSALEGKDLLVEGRVTSVSRKPVRPLLKGFDKRAVDVQKLVRFDFLVSEIHIKVDAHVEEIKALRGEKIRLSWRQSELESLVPEVGQRWHLQVKLKRPRGFVNPGGFDYQAWLLSKNIVATGYVKTNHSEQNYLLEERGFGFFEKTKTDLEKSLFADRGQPNIAILRALLLGDKSSIAPEQWRVLRVTGTAHLMAISGLHIGLMAFFGFFFARVVLCRPLLLFNSFLRLKTQQISLILPATCSILSSGFYAGLSGFAVPTQRAWMVVLFVNIAYLLGRRCSGLFLLLLVAGLVLLVNPFAATQHGFWLSFASVFYLLFSFSSLVGKKIKHLGLIMPLLKAQFVVFIGLIVVLGALSLPISLVSPLANIVAVPVMSFVVIPLLFSAAFVSTASTEAGSVLLNVCLFFMDYLWGFLKLVALIEHTHTIPKLSMLQLLVGVFASLLILIHRATQVRAFGYCLLLVFLFSRTANYRELEVVVLDVGQGLAVVMHMPNHTVVYDLGAKLSENFDIGSAVVAKYLKSRGVELIDLVIISHGDNDHAGGLAGLASELDYRKLAYNTQFKDARKQTMCRAGSRWRFDEVSFEALWPPADRKIDSNDNNDSCVILVRRGSFSLLLTGDIEAAVEKELISEGLIKQGVDILIAPHHGSRSSSSDSFISSLAPDHIVVSAGYKNPYHHPAEEVIARYLASGAEIWRTDIDGAISIWLEPNGSSTIAKARELHRRPWHQSH